MMFVDVFEDEAADRADKHFRSLRMYSEANHSEYQPSVNAGLAEKLNAESLKAS